MNKNLDIDELELIKEKIEDQQADMEEKREFFVRAGQIEDEDELLGELEELEAQMAEEEMGEIEIGSGIIHAAGGG